MMQDFIRTSTYQRVINENYMDFSGKVVLDVGAGSGILSFFAAHVGAKRVYAIEASSMAQYAKVKHYLTSASSKLTLAFLFFRLLLKKII